MLVARRSSSPGSRPVAARRRRPALTWIPLLALLTVSCGWWQREAETPSAGAGNYCSLVGKILWTSNRSQAAAPPAVTCETFNIFRMNDDGSDIVRLTDDTWPVVNQHPVFTPSCERVVWASQRSGSDDVLFAPGWQVSAATPHPAGQLAILAEDHDGDGSFRLIEIDVATGTNRRTLTDDRQDNTIPYYAHPDGDAFDWIRWPWPGQQRRSRDLAWARTDLSQIELLTQDAWEDTKILGELEIPPGDPSGCVPRPVGCYPTPPPCARFLLPEEVAEDAEKLGRDSGESEAAPDMLPDAGYRELLAAGLARYLEAAEIEPQLVERAERLSAYLAGEPGDEAHERVADLYINSFLAAAGSEAP